MDMKAVVRTLHPLEVKVLGRYEAGSELSTDRLVRELGYVEGQANQALNWLANKALAAESGRISWLSYEMTPLGREWLDKGLPEERIVDFLAKNGPSKLPDIAAALGIDQKDIGSSFGKLSKEGVVAMDAEKRAAVADASKSSRAKNLRALLAKVAGVGGVIDDKDLDQAERAAIAEVAKKRGAGDAAFRASDRETVLFTLTPACAEAVAALAEAGITGEETGAVTQELLEKGTWKDAVFRPYNVKGKPARLELGRRNPYVEFLDSVKDKLVSLGFQEFDGSLVETEFWNCDALFMPQFHSARDIHDVYYVADPTRAKSIEQPHLDNVAETHENGGPTQSRGWNYSFDRDFTKRLILRSHGTVLSARQLPKAEVPGKYFGIARCFRYDRVDATHLSDFYQTEGIVIGEDVNLRTLLGFLKMFATEVAGAKEVKYVPGYFPFTEPSVEVHIKHPVLGWFELGGAGIFRPEVTEPLGVKVPVAAWGLGIDRMALMALGLNDLRELFSPDIENIRLRRNAAR